MSPVSPGEGWPCRQGYAGKLIHLSVPRNNLVSSMSALVVIVGFRAEADWYQGRRRCWFGVMFKDRHWLCIFNFLDTLDTGSMPRDHCAPCISSVVSTWITVGGSSRRIRPPSSDWPSRYLVQTACLYLDSIHLEPRWKGHLAP